MRNDDSCPTCRADRSIQSIASGGYRPEPAPREPPVVAGFGGMMFFADESDSDVFFGLGPSNSDMGFSLTRGFQNAVRNRNSRASSHPALARDADVNPNGAPDTYSDAVIAAAFADPAIAAAMDGLANPGSMDVQSFLAAVHGSGSNLGLGAGIPQARRRRHRHIHPALAVEDDSERNLAESVTPRLANRPPMAVLPNRPRQYL